MNDLKEHQVNNIQCFLDNNNYAIELKAFKHDDMIFKPFN